MCFAAEIGLNFYIVCLKITWLVGNLIFLSGPLSEDREANCTLIHGNMKHLLNALLDGAFSTLAPENRMLTFALQTIITILSGLLHCDSHL